MEYKVRISEDAENDLFDIYYYVAVNDSFANADKLCNKLTLSASKLARYPMRGHFVKEISDTYPEIREVICGPYLILYELENSIVTVLAILDGRRDVKKILEERFLR